MNADDGAGQGWARSRWPLRLLASLLIALPMPLLAARVLLRTEEAVAFAVAPAAPSALKVGRIRSFAEDGLVVHAATVIADGQHGLFAAWFEGSVEASPDVVIRGARFDGEAWGAPKTLVERGDLSAALGQRIGTLGNPVLYRDANGRVHLFVVAVPYGGWAVSRIAHLVSDDGGESFRPIGLLPLSPFLNISHLVRNAALTRLDGSFLLPAYFELGANYPVLLDFDADGTFLHRRRMTGADRLIQPTAIADGKAMRLFFRDDGTGLDRVWTLSADEAHFSAEARPLDIANPGAAVAALASADGGVWLALNPDADRRTRLVMTKLDREMRVVETIAIADALDGLENSYPALAVTPDGITHLIYTGKRQRLVHVELEKTAP